MDIFGLRFKLEENWQAPFFDTIQMSSGIFSDDEIEEMKSIEIKILEAVKLAQVLELDVDFDDDNGQYMINNFYIGKNLTGKEGTEVINDIQFVTNALTFDVIQKFVDIMEKEPIASNDQRFGHIMVSENGRKPVVHNIFKER